MSTILSIIFNFLLIVLKYLILPILIIFVLIIIIKMGIEYEKYGNRIFSVFSPKDISNTRDELLYISLDKITWYKKIIKSSILKSNYILIDGNGITLFKIFTDVGLFNGTNTSKYFYYRNNGREHRIANPLLILSRDEKIINRLLPNIKVTKYLVVTEFTHVDVNTDSKTINFSKIPYNLEENKLYTEKQIDDMEDKIK
ncbi:MAG: hypothetical protein IJ565_04195 [Bacilli bacterium]|nr:hypothetical protein [Bacilli bacterium]